MKKLSILSLIVAGLLLMVTSCTKDWEDMNVDPNEPSEVPATNLLVHTLRYAGANFFDDWQGMNNFMSYAGQVTKVQYTDEAHYAYREITVNHAWRDYYDLQADLKRIIDLSDTPEKANMKAAALTFSVMLWQMATDQWGDIPYTNALQGEDGVTNPTYDTQASIYADLVVKLKTAADLFATGVQDVNGDGTPDGGNLGNGDIIYGDSPAAWQMFCNSLRLRVATRISDIDPSTSDAIFSEVLGDAATYPIFTSVADQATLTWAGISPYYDPWYYNKHVDHRDDHGMAITLVDSLISLSDPRLAVYADTIAGGTYVGSVEGVSGTPTGISRLGAFFRDNPTGQTYFMRYAEVEFIIAEHNLDQTAYEAGIAASFSEYGLDADVAAYLVVPEVAWDSGVLTNLEKVRMQKWISIFKEGQEAWAEQRRTDFPALAEAPGSPYGTHNRQPFRYPYPTSEENLNSTNLSAVTSGIVDNFWGKQMWWDTRTGVN